MHVKEYVIIREKMCDGEVFIHSFSFLPPFFLFVKLSYILE